MTPTQTDTYDYGMDTGEPDPEDWNDRLLGYNGVDITYDDMGNPLSYYNGSAYTFTWTQGRRLATATTGGKALSFTYNESGIRTSKIVDGVKHEYVVDGTKIISDSWTENNIKHLVTYIYDAKGVIGMAYRNNSMSAGTFEYYIFEKNLQGDIVAVYDTSGTKLVSYTYDAWGNFTPDYEPGGDSTAVIYNSFRYRGYFYDEDTGLYYLNSRYYDPATGRFINADVYVSTGTGFSGYNMYAYCNNNPIAFLDYSGNEPISLTIAGLATAALVAILAVGAVYVAVEFLTAAVEVGYEAYVELSEGISEVTSAISEKIDQLNEDHPGEYYVYTLKNTEGDILYVGRTKDLKKRLAQHKRSKKMVI